MGATLFAPRREALVTKQQRAQKRCDEWNAANPVGTPVNLQRDDGAVQLAKTRSEAYVCESGYAVIFLEGVRGYYMLNRVSRVPS